MGDVGGLGGPGRDRAQARRDDEDRVGALRQRLGRLAIAQKRGQLGGQIGGQRGLGGHQVHIAGLDAGNALMDSLQARQQLLNAEIAQGIDAVRLALEGRQVQGHGGGGLRRRQPVGGPWQRRLVGRRSLKFYQPLLCVLGSWGQARPHCSNPSRSSGPVPGQLLGKHPDASRTGPIDSPSGSVSSQRLGALQSTVAPESLTALAQRGSSERIRAMNCSLLRR